MGFTEQQIRSLLEDGEGRALEFKSGLPRDDKAARTICAFANTRGGLLLVGVDDKGRVVGAGRVSETAMHIRAIAERYVEPPARIDVDVLRIDGLPVICAWVPLSGHRPHVVLHDDGTREIVVRVGSSNRTASGATLKALRGHSGRAGPKDALERRVLAWVEQRTRKSDRPGGDATVAAFAKANNVGVQRARRAFVDLERSGDLVAFGFGAQRVYARA